MRAAVVIDHALGIAGGARSVIERDGVPFVVRHRPGVVGIALRDELLVFDGAQPLARAGVFRVVVVDHQRLRLAEGERLLHHLGEFAVGDHHLGLGVIEREGDDRRVEPGVERVEHALRHRHAVMAFQHRRRVGEHHRDGVAALDAALGQRRGEPPRARIELGVIAPQRPVDDGGVAGKHGRRALEKAERRQRLVIGRIAVEIGVVGRFRHWVVSPSASTLAKGRSACQPRKIVPLMPLRTNCDGEISRNDDQRDAVEQPRCRA